MAESSLDTNNMYNNISVRLEFCGFIRILVWGIESVTATANL